MQEIPENSEKIGKKEFPSTSKRKAEWFDVDEDHNKYVYVSGLPQNTTEEDFIDLMRKYGVIDKKPIPGQPFNIKLYRNKDGALKGDGLCCYVSVASVNLALEMLDGYTYDEKHTLHCERAKFELKGSYDPSKKPRPLDKRAKKKKQMIVDKLLSWAPEVKPEVKQTRVVLKSMFTPEEIIEDATLILDIKTDVEEKCKEFVGEPKRVEVHDKHPEGVVEVLFGEPAQAELFVMKVDGQFYAGRMIKAELWDGKTRYKIKESEEEARKRLEKWHEDIEKSDDKDKQDEEPGKNKEVESSVGSLRGSTAVGSVESDVGDATTKQVEQINTGDDKG